MRFGKTLRSSIYEPWRSKYIDYSRLKKLLRDDSDTSGDLETQTQDWTEEDEGAFVDELVNNQLEKVNGFHNDTYKSLRDRTTECEAELQKLAVSGNNGVDKASQFAAAAMDSDEDMPWDILQKLEDITKEINELEKYSRINFTGFLKAAKKHDRRRGSHYCVRPLLQVRLAALPFNSEDYSPLLYQYVSI